MVFKYGHHVNNIKTMHNAIKDINETNYISTIASMESVLHGELTDNLPVGTIKEKITELLRIALVSQTKELLLALSSLKNEIKDETKNVDLVYRQDILNTVKERFNQPLKQTTIPSYHQMNEIQREGVLKIVQKVFESEDLPSVDFVNKVIDIYNSGSPKSVVCNNIGISFSYDNSDMFNKEHVRQVITDERVVLYLTERLNKTLGLIKKIDDHNNVDIDTLIGYFNEYINDVEKDDRKELVEDAILKSGYESDSKLIQLKEVTKSIISSTNHVISIVNDTDENLFSNLTEEDKLNAMFANVDKHKAYLVSNQYLNVLESITFTIRGVKLLIAVVRESVEITKRVIDDLAKVDEKLDTLYNQIIELSNESNVVSQEGIWSSFIRWLTGVGEVDDALKAEPDPRDLVALHKRNKARVISDIKRNGFLSGEKLELFKSEVRTLLMETYNIDVDKVSDRYLLDLLKGGIDEVENMKAQWLLHADDVVYAHLNDVLIKRSKMLGLLKKLPVEIRNKHQKDIVFIRDVMRKYAPTELKQWVLDNVANPGGDANMGKSLIDLNTCINMFKLVVSEQLSVPSQNEFKLNDLYENVFKKTPLTAATAMRYLTVYGDVHEVCYESDEWNNIISEIGIAHDEVVKSSTQIRSVINEHKETIGHFVYPNDDKQAAAILKSLIYSLSYDFYTEDLKTFFNRLNDLRETVNLIPSIAVVTANTVYSTYLSVAS